MALEATPDSEMEEGRTQLRGAETAYQRRLWGGNEAYASVVFIWWCGINIDKEEASGESQSKSPHDTAYLHR